MRTLRGASAAAAAVVLAASSVTLANTGTQLPLSQIQAGTEQTSNALVVNGGFEQPGTPGPNATGWTRVDDMNVNSPIPPLPNPPSVLGNFTARGALDNAKYSQNVTLQANTDYVISAYIWNFGVPGPAPHNDLTPGDLAVVELVDPDNGFNTAGIILEPIALDNGDADNGYFLYDTFNSSQFPNLQAILEVEVDLEGNPGTQRPPVVAQFDNIALTPAAQFIPPMPGGGSSTWNTNGSGSWSVASNWTGGVPSGVGAIANFGTVITAPVTVTLDSDRTVGSVNFAGSQKYTIAGTNTLTFDVASGSAGISYGDFGTQEIATPVQLQDDTRVSVLLSGSTVRLSGQLSAAAGVTLTKAGNGVLEMRNVRTPGLNVSAGTLRVLADGTANGLSTVNTLNVDTPSARLDITNNGFVVDYTGASPLNDIRADIVFAYNNGAWDAPGITSSSANAGQFAVGYAEASALTSVPPFFGTVDSTAVLMRLTRYGDANLDGTVNLQDFNRLAGAFGSNGLWSQGDFNYDGTINLQDFNKLAANFGLSAAGPEITPQDWARLGAAVPEPSSLVLLAGAGAALLVRKRRA
jgi:hypothetical protein